MGVDQINESEILAALIASDEIQQRHPELEDEIKGNSVTRVERLRNGKLEVLIRLTGKSIQLLINPANPQIIEKVEVIE